MAIDPRIILSGQGVRLPSAMEIEEARAARQRNKLADLAFAEKERAAQDANAISGLYRDATNPDGTLNRDKFLSGAAQKGFGSRIPEWQKGFAEQDEAQFKAQKAQRDAQKGQLDVALSKAKLYGQVTGAATDQASWERGLQFLQSQGEDISQLKPIYDPAYVEQGRRMALDAVQQFELAQKKLDYDLEVQKAAETKRHNKATEAAAIRGQNMVDARARETSEQGKPPAGYQWTPDGKQLVAIPGGPADKAAAATEGERKAATLLKRLQSSRAQLKAALADNPSAAKPGLVANGLRAVGADSLANTVATSGTRQRVEAAQLDILDAALTLGTGAAYTREQLEGYRKSYFPQIGDTPETIADKQARLSAVIEAAEIAAGRAAPKAAAPKPAGSQAGGKQDIHAQAEAILRGE